MTSLPFRIGLRPGDIVATMAWNTHRVRRAARRISIARAALRRTGCCRGVSTAHSLILRSAPPDWRLQHMECWYAIMGEGAVCHTLNPRLFVDQLVRGRSQRSSARLTKSRHRPGTPPEPVSMSAHLTQVWIANHAEDSIILVDFDLVPIILKMMPQLKTVRHVIVMTGGFPPATPPCASGPESRLSRRLVTSISLETSIPAAAAARRPPPHAEAPGVRAVPLLRGAPLR